MDSTISSIKDPPGESSPQILVTPNPVDFGIVPAGEQASEIITLSSVGDSTLNVTAMQIGLGRETFALLAPLPGAYEPDTFAELTITYTSDGSATTGDLQILSNDPVSPNTTVLLLAGSEVIVDTGDTGTVDPPLSAPVAVCSVNPDAVLAIHESADWIGSTSYDSDGGAIVDYSWTLYSAPAGATATMPSGTANRRGFAPDVAGEYVGELVVTDDSGLSSDDMDLHLLDNSGTLTTDSDCYFANCAWSSLDWGVGGRTDDNPTLDLDDIPGTGPENINIDSPARGTYTVYVHDYPGSAYVGRNDVTVNVYLASRLIWTDTRNINSEGCYEPFVAVTIPAGTVIDMAGGCR